MARIYLSDRHREKELKFCIRVDDYGWTATDPKQSDKGLRLAQRFHDSLQGLPYIAGVIPLTVDHDGLAWLQSKPTGLTIALHGLKHSHSSGGVASEFHGMDVNQCRQHIAWGRTALQGIPIVDMILPFNGYEVDLAEACYLEGIYRIWGGGLHSQTTPSAWPTPPQPYPLGRVTFVPSWAPLYGATQWRMSADTLPLTETLPSVMNSPGKGIITLHITWEASKSADFSGVKWLADKIANWVISPEEYLK
jgi:hypothetical protein